MSEKKPTNLCKPIIFPTISRQTHYNSQAKQQYPYNNKTFTCPSDSYEDQAQLSDFRKDLKESLNSLEKILSSQMPKSYKKHYHCKKPKAFALQKCQQMKLEQAQEIITSTSKSNKEKQNASRVVVQNLFKKAYGENMEIEQQQSMIRQKSSSKSILDVGILQQILTEIQHNPNSHSIAIRKSQLGNLKSDLFKMREERQKKDESNNSFKEERRIQTIYKLKNQYFSLKNCIIPSKSEEYQALRTAFTQNKETVPSMSMSNSNFKHTFLLTGLYKQNKVITNCNPSVYKTIQYFEKFKAFRNSSLAANQRGNRFQKTQDKLIIENISQISPNTFLYLVSQCRFQLLKVIKIRFLKSSEDLLFFFLDCMKFLGKKENIIDFFQITSVTIQNSKKFSEKLALMFETLSIKVIKIESMELTTRQFLKIGGSLAKTKVCQELSFRHNRIDILGVRLMENLCEEVPTLRLIDTRNNQIPHYANLKDKNPIIQFF